MTREAMWEIPLMGGLQRTADTKGLGKGAGIGGGIKVQDLDQGQRRNRLDQGGRGIQGRHGALPPVQRRQVQVHQVQPRPQVQRCQGL
eukprot:11391438-Heterocapsa_arctica.AAC.1